MTLTWSPFSAEQMSQIGTVWLDATLSRIRRGVDATDSQAKPLTKRYARLKLTRGRAPIRDWQWRTPTGVTLAAAKVKMASQDRVTIGFISAQANQIAAAQNRICKMWGVSPHDMEAVQAAIRETLKQHVVRSVHRAA